MRLLAFSEASLRDIDDIGAASEERWGEAQRDRYLAEICRRIDRLPERPELGPPFGPRKPGLRRLSVGRHIVFYRFDDVRVRITRILDQSMDLPMQLDGSEEL